MPLSRNGRLRSLLLVFLLLAVPVWGQNGSLTILSTSPLPNGQVGQPYSFTFTASGGLFPYSWGTEAGVPPGLELNSAGELTGTPTTAGTYNMEVYVFSEGYGSGFGSFQITIASPINFVTGSPLPPATAGTPYPALQFSASGGTSPYTWTQIGGSFPTGMSLSPAGLLSGTPTTAGLYDFTIHVIDNGGNQAQRNYFLVVNAPVQTLAITSTSPLPNATQGSAYNYVFQAAGGFAPRTWTLQSGTVPPGLNLFSNGTFSGTPTAPGTYDFTVQVNDAGQQTASRSFTIEVQGPINITSTSPLPPGGVGEAYLFAFAATGGTPPYNWALAGGTLPPGLTLATNGTLSGIPTTAGTFPFSITASAQNLTSSARSFELTIVPPLSITSSSPLPAGSRLDAYTFAFMGQGGLTPYTWVRSSGMLPPGLTLDTSGGLSGTPTQAGEYSFEIQLTDSRGTSVTRPFVLTISSPINITTRTIPNGAVNQPYSQAFAAQGGATPYTWRITAGIPPSGLRLTEGGMLSGTPTAPGPYTLTIQVRDANGATDSVTVAFTIAPAPLTVGTPALLPQAVLNQPYSHALIAEGGIPPYTWTLAEGSLPPGLVFTSGGEIRGTPNTPGTYDFTVLLTDIATNSTAAKAPDLEAAGETDRLASATFPFRLAVVAPPIAITTTSPLPEGLAGSPYSVTLIATGGRAAIIWAVTSGALPAGLRLESATGVISGIPANDGSFTFTIQARDNLGPSALRTFTLVIRSDADLVLSATSASFRANVGGASPPTQSISVVSRQSQLTPYRVTFDPVSWFTLVSGAEASTPGRFVFGVNPAGLSAGTYRTTLRVESVNTRQILAVPVSFDVTAAAPAIVPVPDLVQVNRQSLDENLTPSVVLENAGGGGPLAFTARVIQGGSWLAVEPAQGTVEPNTPLPLRFIVNPANLGAGYSRGVVRVESAAGTTDIPVTVANPTEPRFVRLDPEGWFFSARQGNGALRGNRTFTVLNTGSVAQPYTVEVVAGAQWIRLGKTSGTVPPGGSDAISFSVEPGALNTANYYGRIRVTASGAQNSPVDFVAVLQVVPADQTPIPDATPSGLVFVAAEGGVAPDAQTVQVYASSSTPVPYQAAVVTEDRSGWLAVNPATGVTFTGNPASLRVAVNPSNLKRGVYFGRVNISLSTTVVRSVQVTAIITPPAALAASADRPLTGCTPARLVATHTGLTGNFSSPVAWPVPLAVRVSDDCGETVRSAQVTASFSNGDPPLPLRLSDPNNGVYSATWVPAGSAQQLTISAAVTAPDLAPATADLIGSVAANRAPLVGRSGVLHSFFPQLGAPVAPGTLVQIVGQDLASSEATATFPAPDTLAGVTVLISGRPAPLLYVSPQQINAQVPFELSPETPHTVLVASGAALAMPQSLPLNPVQPGVASDPDAIAVAQRADGTPISAANPAAPGDVVTLFLAGLGATDPEVPAGTVSPADPPATVLTPVSVHVGEIPVEVTFAGLAPGLVGVYQVTFALPGDAPAGDLEVVIRQGGATANVVRLPVGP